MKTTLRAANLSEKQIEEIYTVLSLICKQEKLQLEERGDRVVIEICPQGNMECVQEGSHMIIEAHTSHGGPGFHAYCVNLLEWIDEECEAECVVSDDCGFVEHPDFQRLKYEVFYPWLSDLKRLLLEDALDHHNYYFDSSHYLVAKQDDVIITPCGFIDRHEFEQMDVEQLAPYFFLWNEEERDAQFYKNCALHLLAKEGYGRYARMNEHSEKYASMIVDYIEAAYAKDPLLPLPVQPYHELCTLLGRDEAIGEGVMMDEEVSQYRHQEVYHLFHEWSIYAPGCCERSYDAVHDVLYLMAPYADASWGWEWMWQISSHALEPSKWEGMEEEGERWQNDTVFGIVWTSVQEDLTLLQAVLSAEDRLYIEIVVREASDLPYLKACIQKCGRHLLQG